MVSRAGNNHNNMPWEISADLIAGEYRHPWHRAIGEGYWEYLNSINNPIEFFRFVVALPSIIGGDFSSFTNYHFKDSR